MSPQFSQQLDHWARKMAPIVSTFALLIVGTIPLPIPNYSMIAPSLTIMAVFCWALWRPELMPYFAVFAIGLFEDLLRGTPFGVCALALLFVQATVRSHSRMLYGKSFEILWLGFVLVAGAATVLRWMIMSLMNDTLVGPEPVLFHYLATAALFPLLATVFLRMQQTILKQI